MQPASSRDRGGLALNELRLVDYNPDWPRRFEEEARRLKSVSSVVAIEHIGSTALPDIKAKPVIDIAMSVSGEPDDPRVLYELSGLGYISHGEYGLSGRQFFTRGNPPAIHLHVVTQNSPCWQSWLTFRNFLLNHPDWLKKYETEKCRILIAAAGDRAAYTKMKGNFINKVIELAGTIS